MVSRYVRVALCTLDCLRVPICFSGKLSDHNKGIRRKRGRGEHCTPFMLGQRNSRRFSERPQPDR